MDSNLSLENAVNTTLAFLENIDNHEGQRLTAKEALAFIRKGLQVFQKYVTAMYFDSPHKSGTLTEDTLKRFSIGNEYDVQRMLYAWLRPVFPLVRQEVNSDNGYGGMRADLYLDEYDLIIEVKCTRPNMTVKKLTEKLGADCFHYPAKNVYIYIYDKAGLIKNTEAFGEAFRRDAETDGKMVRVFVNQNV